ATRNVESQRSDSGSMLTLHRRLLALRRDHAALAVGDYRGLPVEAADVFAYERSADGESLRVILNFGDAPQSLPVPEGDWVVLLSTLA
ncbi:alpha-glucosidase C-terminal domain-containing protein, partial [Acinetobacter baumannii]|nr:alpha-glucosidase C-terminal domain-containing protein [Acinetobacter baumannii]